MLRWSYVILLLVIASVHSAHREVCGISNSSIPGYSLPWIAAIFMEKGGVTSFSVDNCGGSLISNEFVLGAANCVFLRDGTTRHLPSAFTIRFGVLDILSTKDNDTFTEVGVSEVIPHPGYNSKTFHNDIALFRLDKPIVEFTKSVTPICLPSSTLMNKDLTGLSPYVAGWDRITTAGISSNILRHVQLKIVSNEQCKQSYSRFIKQTTIEPNQLCAGLERGGKDACLGTSGGPLMLVRNQRWTVIGIISYGFRCEDPRYPGVYTRTTAYLDWVLTNAQMQ